MISERQMGGPRGQEPQALKGEERRQEREGKAQAPPCAKALPTTLNGNGPSVG